MKKDKTNILIAVFIILFVICLFIIIFMIVNQFNINKNDEQEIAIVEEYQEIQNEIDTMTVVIEDKEEEVLVEPELIPLETTYQGYPTAGRIAIPRTGLDSFILGSVTVGGMKIAPCLIAGTGEINKSGNTYIVGHNYQNGKLFSENDKIVVGDTINITGMDGATMTYVVYNIMITNSTDVSYLQREIGELPELTLQSCTDANNDDRLIIMARKQI